PASTKPEKKFNQTLKKIIATRERSKQILSELGFKFTDSMSNFIFANPVKKSAQYVFEELKKRKIYVRYWNKPIICDYLRISIGTDEEMDKLFNALEEILND
ncbi:MAG: aminotransferase class I/II-fold pyridoxal phosphate-dependent enzyme, partial [Ruminococcus sp.]|nr:aminotransferase class I/II-fold pyridoxal phosphate-dependent enzyme [Ruminococcus sp.]